ncbi:MAG TPA: hypothetical protein PLO69_11005 [Gammaproteobacteria bacterium]|nr:hypothetical protein [Gammaproteobacteria bacterium]
MQYAFFNLVGAAPWPVLGWYDTDVLEYATLPPASQLLPLTAAQWSARLTGQWAVSGGALVAYTPPAPTLTPAQAAAAAYAAFIAAGLTVTSTATPALNGVYAIDPGTQSEMQVEANFIAQFAEFTNGTTSNLVWPLANGTLVTFPTTASFLALVKAAGQQVAAAKVAVMQGSTVMPSGTASL